MVLFVFCKLTLQNVSFVFLFESLKNVSCMVSNFHMELINLKLELNNFTYVYLLQVFHRVMKLHDTSEVAITSLVCNWILVVSPMRKQIS
jgi:hypothetical protein